MARLKAVVARAGLFYDPTREPLRRRVYTALLGLLAAAVTAGIVTGALAASLTGVGAVLLMVPATEYARRVVTPVADTYGRHAADRRPA